MDLLHLAALAAERAGEYIRSAALPGDGSNDRREADLVGSERYGPTDKGHHDWVTQVDRQAEAIIADLLSRGAPESRMVGEESSPDLVQSGLVWIVDPLDGTTNFLHGYPQYAVSIAAAIDGRLEVAVILDVVRELRYGAARGLGAWLGDERLRVSAVSDPGHALLGTGFPFKRLHQLESYLAQFRRIFPATSGVRRAGSAALDLADVAAGRLDGFWELVLAPWDSSAGILLVREAGGVVTDLAGRDVGVAHSPVVAGNPAIHRWLLAQVQA